MTARLIIIEAVTVAAICVVVWHLAPRVANAHCDTLDGPVVMAAKMALENGDVVPVLKWVKPEYEGEIHATFDKTLTVRRMGPDARELADMYFFETLVRLHRAGEGAPHEGIKPAGTNLGPAVAGADEALETGSVEPLVGLLTREVAEGLRERFALTVERKKHADESVEAGREFVEAYVEFVHYAERLHLDATGHAAHGESEGAGVQASHHP